MTQHLRTTPVRSCKSTQGTLYRTVCGRWVTSAQANGPGGVTCRACKRTMEAGQ